MSDTVWVYALADPESGEHRYIGCSVNPERRRMISLSDSRSHHSHGQPAERGPKYQWVRSLLERDLEPQLVLLEQSERVRGWQIEAQWIEQCRSSGCRVLNARPPHGGPWRRAAIAAPSGGVEGNDGNQDQPDDEG